MKAMPVLMVIALLSMSACGNTSTGASSLSQASSNAVADDNQTTTALSATSIGSYFKDDGDKDSDDERHSRARPNDDRNLLASFPSKPNQADRRAITTLVKSYYAAAAAEDGTKACTLLYASFAAGLAEGTGGDNACATSVDRLLKGQHPRLADDQVSTMVVTSVHLKDDTGLALLGFRRMPEGEILVEREGHNWKIGSLFDSEIP